ncbi:MAG: superoxide dismutase [Ignavibacteria bacterium]|jgi:predicted transcriptional regulator
MKILAIEKENQGINQDEFKKYAEEEAVIVWKLYKTEKIREIYFRGDQDNAVIILECENVKEAEEILASLPFVKNKLIHFDFIPLKPYPGFERLFGKN